MKDADCLQYDPFQGDETDVTKLSDRFLVTRKPHQCNVCLGQIPAGQRVRALTEINHEEKKVSTFYFCVLCCEAMALVWTDAGLAIEARTSIGMMKANASRFTGFELL